MSGSEEVNWFGGIHALFGCDDDLGEFVVALVFHEWYHTTYGVVVGVEFLEFLCTVGSEFRVDGSLYGAGKHHVFFKWHTLVGSMDGFVNGLLCLCLCLVGCSKNVEYGADVAADLLLEGDNFGGLYVD